MSGTGSYWDDRLRENWDLRGVGMQVLSHSYNRWLYRVRERAFRRTTRRLRSDWSGSMVLDAGVGTGFFLERWLDAGVREAWGLDISRVAVDRLQRRFPAARIVCADLGGSIDQLPRGAFEAVSVFDTLFHIVDDDAFHRALANIARILLPGGHVLLSENFLHHGERRHEDYWRSRTLACYETALAEVGLEVVERRPLFVLMTAPVDTSDPWIERLWQRVIRVARGERLGAALGAALYPAEVLLASLLRESPTTELMVCRRK